MGIDIRTEQVISLTEAARLPFLQKRRGGKPINFSTLWRWSINGVRGVKLETIMCGGARSTSIEAIERFFKALTVAADARPRDRGPSSAKGDNPRGPTRPRIDKARQRIAAHS